MHIEILFNLLLPNILFLSVCLDIVEVSNLHVNLKGKFDCSNPKQRMKKAYKFECVME